MFLSIFLNCTIQIQSRDVRNHIGEENTTLSLMDWKVRMFDQKWFEVYQSSFHMLI